MMTTVLVARLIARLTCQHGWPQSCSRRTRLAKVTGCQRRREREWETDGWVGGPTLEKPSRVIHKWHSTHGQPVPLAASDEEKTMRRREKETDDEWVGGPREKQSPTGGREGGRAE
jgi:hypothetical protein